MMKTYGVVMVCALGLLLGGCWDRREINDLAFVSASAVDLVDGQYRLAIQIPLVHRIAVSGGGAGGGGGEQATWFIHSTLGTTLRGAVDEAQRSSSRSLTFSHRRIMLLGEELARAGVTEALDVMIRVPENRLNSVMVVTEGEARDVISARVPVEDFSSEAARELILALMRRPTTIKSFMEMLLNPGLDAHVPILKVTQAVPGGDGKPESLIKLAGVGIFRHDRLIEVLKGDEATAFLWAVDEALHQSVSVPAPGTSTGPGPATTTIRFENQSAEHRASLSGDQLTVRIRLDGVGFVTENVTRWALSYGSNLLEYEAAVNRHLEQQANKVVHRLQHEIKADAVGLGAVIHRQLPSHWNRISHDWVEHYPKVKVVVEARVRLAHTGTLMAPSATPERDWEVE